MCPRHFRTLIRSSALRSPPHNLRATVNTLAGFGSRVAGYPGDKQAGDYVAQQFQTLGLSSLQTDTFAVTVPYDLSVDDPEQGAFAEC